MNTLLHLWARVLISLLGEKNRMEKTNEKGVPSLRL